MNDEGDTAIFGDGVAIVFVHRQILQGRHTITLERRGSGMETQCFQYRGYAANATDGRGIFGFVGQDPEGMEGLSEERGRVEVLAHGSEDGTHVVFIFFSAGCCF